VTLRLAITCVAVAAAIVRIDPAEAGGFGPSDQKADVGSGMRPAATDAAFEQDLMSSMSIVAFDPETGDVGICLASKFFAVGPIATFARAGVGAVAVMGGGPFKEGERLLDWLGEGLTPAQVLARLRGLYPDTGQINIVNAKGESLSTTGPNASQWKGHRFGANYAAAGNILAGPQVVDAFGESFETTAGQGLPLAERLLRALEAADAAGGDARGRQGTALKVYRKGAGFRGTDLLVDLRVDDSANSVADLRRLWAEWQFHRLHGVGFQPIEQSQGSDVRQLQRYLLDLGYLRRGQATVFDDKGEARGVFNDATADAVARWKKAAGFDATPSLVPFMLRTLESAALKRRPPTAKRTMGAPIAKATRNTNEDSTTTTAKADAVASPAGSDRHLGDDRRYESGSNAATLAREDDLMSSMSIVGFDPATGDVGIAMASRFFAVGPIATHVRAGVGAIATMGGAPYKDGDEMLDWLQQGASPQEVLDRLRTRYPDIGQINIVDAKGRSVTTTGAASEWKGGRTGRHYATAGNILAGPQVVDAFAQTFEKTDGSGLPLAERLLQSLEAADAAGGDARGRLGATLRVYRKGAGPFGTDIYLDVRVDDSAHSIADVRALYERWKQERSQAYGSRVVGMSSGDDVRQLQRWLLELGYAKSTDRGIIDAQGQPRGVMNDATVAAVVAFKKEHQLGAAPSANREVVTKMVGLRSTK
jgi:uncharacterized Ntn-hydrolase superfamily protein